MWVYITESLMVNLRSRNETDCPVDSSGTNISSLDKSRTLSHPLHDHC